MRDILRHGSAAYPDERDGLQPACEPTVGQTSSDVNDVKADLL